MDAVSIKVKKNTWEALIAQMRVRETFDQSITRLLKEREEAIKALSKRRARQGKAE